MLSSLDCLLPPWIFPHAILNPRLAPDLSSPLPRLRWKFINRISRQISRTSASHQSDWTPRTGSQWMRILIPWECCEDRGVHRSSLGAATSAACPLISPSLRWSHWSPSLATQTYQQSPETIVITPSPATLYGSSSGTGMRGLLRISTGLSFFTESKDGCYWQTKSTGWQLIRSHLEESLTWACPWRRC